MKRIAVWILVLVFLLAAAVPVAAAGPETGESGDTSSAAGEPSPEPSTSEPVRRAKLYIDNQNVYKDMKKSYTQGYVPSVSGGSALLVLPLLCDSELQGSSLRAAVTLGDTGSSPFVSKNYEKNVSLSSHEVNDGKKTVKSYLVSFALQLKADRFNGSYPVSVRVSAEDKSYEEVTQEFTVFVTITDGKDPNATPSPEPVRRAKLYIDNQNVYKDMKKSYTQGYVPSVSGGSALLVLPLLCDSELQGNSLRAEVTLGDTGSSPFVGKNYEKTVSLSSHKVNEGKKTVKSYLVSFSLQLKAERFNGSYPVSVRVSAEDKNFEDVTQEFTVFVTITDGKDPNATPAPEPIKEEPVVLGPKILVRSVEAQSLEEDAETGVINAGDRVQVRITLENTSQTEDVENMTVTVGSPGDGFLFTDAADSTYIGNLSAGETVDITCDYTVKPETPAGQYEIPISFDFAYAKGMTGAGTGIARVNIRQPLELEFSFLQMPAEAVLADTVEVSVQAINLSRAKAYNVRASVEGDGLSPAGVAFIGDLDGGTSEQIPLQILITGLLGGTSPYGMTEGTITYQYEDGDGNEYSLEESFSLNIRSPFSETQNKEEDDPGQWWIVMACIGAVLLFIVVFLALRKTGRHRAG